MPSLCTEWSAPSAIGTAGFGFGGQGGAEITDFLIVLSMASTCNRSTSLTYIIFKILTPLSVLS
jgi:lipid-binding SYLF domain-containing protein